MTKPETVKSKQVLFIRRSPAQSGEGGSRVEGNSLSLWAQSRSDRSFKAAATVCQHRNPENEASMMLRALGKAAAPDLV